MVATAGFFAGVNQRLLWLGFRDAGVIRDRKVSRGRRQRSKCFNWHKNACLQC